MIVGSGPVVVTQEIPDKVNKIEETFCKYLLTTVVLNDLMDLNKNMIVKQNLEVLV